MPDVVRRNAPARARGTLFEARARAGPEPAVRARRVLHGGDHPGPQEPRESRGALAVVISTGTSHALHLGAVVEQDSVLALMGASHRLGAPKPFRRNAPLHRRRDTRRHLSTRSRHPTYR